jgi:uncharacterized protein YceH (UPF0502 family)
MEKTLPQLSFEEQRVLGVLIEKSRATPEYYPMTVNAIITASNQKTSRNPIVSYDETTVTETINSLKKKGLLSTVTGGGSRAIKYRHNLAIQFPLVPAELSVICLLLLRGPMTPGEINNNSGRLFEFESLEEVQETLAKLAGDDTPYIRLLEKRPGQKEQRYVHLFGEAPEYVETAPAEKSSPELMQRIEKLEEEVAYLRENLDKLMKEWLG